MKDFKDKVAVVTGGASGLGLAMARRFAAEGMKLVLADVEEEALRKVETEFRKAGTPVVGIRTDVSRAQDVERLAEKTLATFGGVHLLCNNAGVSPVGRVWDYSDEDFRWLVGVNLFGVANGLRSFVPRMIEQGEGHLVNTGSGASFVATPRLGAYCATKHAIVGMSEALRYELEGTGIGVSVLVPAGVNTNIAESGARPSASPESTAADFGVLVEHMDETSLQAIEPDVVADVTLVGVKEGWDYIVMGPGQHVGVERRCREVLDAHRRSRERFPHLP